MRNARYPDATRVTVIDSDRRHDLVLQFRQEWICVKHPGNSADVRPVANREYGHHGDYCVLRGMESARQFRNRYMCESLRGVLKPPSCGIQNGRLHVQPIYRQQLARMSADETRKGEGLGNTHFFQACPRQERHCQRHENPDIDSWSSRHRGRESGDCHWHGLEKTAANTLRRRLKREPTAGTRSRQLNVDTLALAVGL